MLKLGVKKKNYFHVVQDGRSVSAMEEDSAGQQRCPQASQPSGPHPCRPQHQGQFSFEVAYSPSIILENLG
jgi:hypothetical protein